MEFTHDPGKEGRDKVAVLWSNASYCADDGSLHPAHFDFNIQECAARKPRQHVVKAGRRVICTGETGLQLPECVPPDRKPVQPGIVADDGLQVAGAADVKLKSIRAMFQSEIKSGEGVFRGVTPGTAMTEQQYAVSRGQSRGFVARLGFLSPS